MSDKLPKPNNSEELDLLQIFSYFERIGKKIISLFVGIFNIFKWILIKLGLFLLIILNVAKKRWILIFLAALIGYLVPYLYEQQQPKLYKSSIIVNQNYTTGLILYNYIKTYNNLARAKDSVNLGKQLHISESLAAKLDGFEITHSRNENSLYEEYYEHIKKLDSTIKRTYKTYIEELALEDSPVQIITCYTEEPEVFNSMAEPLIQALNNNKFYIEEKRKKQLYLRNRIKAIETSISNSDTLQKNYMQLLNKYYTVSEDPANQSTVSLNLAGNKDKIQTKEYELFVAQNEARQELALVMDELERTENIIELQKEFTPPILEETFPGSYKKTIALVLAILVILFYVAKEFSLLDLINKYGTRDNFLKN